MSDKKAIKALVVDDEEVVRDFLIHFLKLEAVEVKVADDGFKAIEAAKEEKFDIVFLEITIPNDGVGVLKALKKIIPDSKYVMMSASVTEDLWEEAKKNGATICLKKPFEINEIRLEIDKVRHLKEL